ncbi:hypothetical protein [Pseudomonas sp. CGJS7]|uniref:hypothetical protein n=1 Tax=Pseudomonas sp. CGJS7 TaxID=3109348 RepID=UPI00300A27EB
MRIETRGPEIGTCNICGQRAKLSADHIPPKGVPRVGQAFLTDLITHLNVNKDKVNRRYFQRGVHYRSICAACNNQLLGGTYDPELVRLTAEIDRAFHRQLYAPIAVTAKAGRVARSAIGHLLANGLNRHREGKVDAQLTDFVLDKDAAFPDELRMYYWLYPDNRQIVIQGAGTMTLGRGVGISFFKLIKFYPIAFMITVGDVNDRDFRFPSLHGVLEAGGDPECRFEFDLTSIPNVRWPEHPRSDDAILYTQGATIATPS